MPRLVRLYIINVLIGFALATLFTGLLVWLDVGHLRHLVLETPKGWLAGGMLVFFNGIVFAGVQFGIVIMTMPFDGQPPRGKRHPIRAAILAPLAIRAASNRRG